MTDMLRGRLVTSGFAREVLPTLRGFREPTVEEHRRMEALGERLERQLGPASGPRAIADTLVIPLLDLLGITPILRHDTPERTTATTSSRTPVGASGPLLSVLAWNEPLQHAWQASVRHAIAVEQRWAIVCNGPSLRVVDTRRTWSRDYLEFDLEIALRDPDGQRWLRALLAGTVVTASATDLDVAVTMSARHGVDVCQALGNGVLDALALLLESLRGRRAHEHEPEALFDHSLTVLYRVLFLLFAEARGLVPVWHPIYRDSYSITTIVSALLAGTRRRGLWRALQAISRLAHEGCTAGSLKMTAFNGRLFSPAHARLFDRTPVGDEVMQRIVIAVSSTPGRSGSGRSRIAYRDLDVEQLGAVYERVLDYEPGTQRGAPLVRTRDVRKATGAFYTPRAVTSHLVALTLRPLVEQRSSDQILALRVLDPAMGSGAFLVSACRYLAAALEDALNAEGRWPRDATHAERAELRRQVAGRCLYGVDLNPMAVQLGRLSLWLATLAADKPLSFLDHHLVAGDSLIGASPADLLRQPGCIAQARHRHASLPLFELDALDGLLADAGRQRLTIAEQSDDTADVVRAKERTLATIHGPAAPLARWRRALDLWCAGWFLDRPIDRGTFMALADRLLERDASLPEHVAAPLLAAVDEIAARHRFLHWPLVFPEVFAAGGFDVVLGNPPWDMVRGDSGTAARRGERQREAKHATAFFRDAGIYRVDSRAHVNRYQRFVERALQLIRPGGRIGLIVPAGLVSDSGSAPLRRHLFSRAAVETIVGFDNALGIFPIHRSVRFVLVAATGGRTTTEIMCRFGVTDPDALSRDGASETLRLTRPLLERLSGADDLGVPELSSSRDLSIVEQISARVPALGSDAGWNVRFGRELNATDDRGAFVPATGAPNARPVLEGKQIAPFRVSLGSAAFQLPAGTRCDERAPQRARLAYRDVASATNRVTLIAAIVPAQAVTTHTLFCLKTPLPIARQHVLCALLNSFVANYLIRLRVHTHVTATLMSRLRVPVVEAGSPASVRLESLARTLATVTEHEATPEYAELQALAAHLYGLSAQDFEHVLSTFPLIPESVRQSALEQFSLVTYDTPRL